jgi:hypothetical protein
MSAGAVTAPPVLVRKSFVDGSLWTFLWACGLVFPDACVDGVQLVDRWPILSLGGSVVRCEPQHSLLHFNRFCSFSRPASTSKIY